MKRKMKEYIVTIISRKQKQEIQLKATNKKEAKEMVIDVITNTYLFKNQKLNNIKIKCRKNRRLIFSVHEVAKMLHSSPNYVYKLINNGYLPAIKLGSVKVLKSTLLKFLIENEGKDLSDINCIKKLDVSLLDKS